MIGEAYDRLGDSIKRYAVGHTDDTDWRIGGKNTFLMGFDADGAAVYQIRFRHRKRGSLRDHPGGLCRRVGQ
jgi:transposase